MNFGKKNRNCLGMSRVGFLASLCVCGASLAVLPLNGADASVVMFEDDFESYAIAKPATDPLGPWDYVGPNDGSPFGNSHRILDASVAGSGFDSRAWASYQHGAGIETTVSLGTLTGTEYDDGNGGVVDGTLLHITFVVGVESGSSANEAFFDYAMSASGAGSISFLDGGNRDESNNFTSLSGEENLVVGGATGKSNVRTYDVYAAADGLALTDNIVFRINWSSPGGSVAAGQYFLLFDDFSLVASSVPEPGSMSLLAICGAGIVSYRRRRDKRIGKIG